MRFHLPSAIIVASGLLALGATAPAGAAEGDAPGKWTGILEEVVVTARRREERLQDVPISITVFNQRQLNNDNVVNAGDLATYTPSLSVNQRFGSENTSFAIRGFTQELRTTASVGTYFAEAVAPRGANAQTSGDGAGPGAFFDLENVQVLKGPQGTLFGRNTTGGAVLLTPQRPTDQLEGYFEGSVGNYDMYRTQGVLNIPVTDRVRMRFGYDRQERDGFLDNITNVGPANFADVDYLAGRASMTIDITDTLSNYTVATAARSRTNGQPATLIDCDAAMSGFLAFQYVPDCQAQLARQQAAGKNDFYDVAGTVPTAGVRIRQWQVINHTDWEITDNIQLKNIFSYADLRTRNSADLFATNFIQPNGGERVFAIAGIRPGLDTTNQSSMVEELRLQGTSFDGSLVWQGGLYYEYSEPEGSSGAQSPAQTICDLGTLYNTDPDAFRCDEVFGLSNLQLSVQGVEYDNRAVYAQTTYDVSPKLSVTGGLRYTWDETKGTSTDVLYGFDRDGVLGPATDITELPTVTMKSESDKPTWVIDASYNPTEDVMVYGKYSRGYRQGGVNPAGQHPTPGFNQAVRIDIHGPEKVDTYELGAKTSFAGAVAGTFNVAAFYNDFSDQQLQNGILTTAGTGSTAIVNAGKSRIWGVEVESSVSPLEGLQLGLSFTYLNTKVLELEDLSALVASTGAIPSSLSVAEGEELPYSPKQQMVASARYLLPTPAELGTVALGASYIYYSSQLAVSESASPLYYKLPSYELVNFNLNWERIADTPIDASLFVTNAFNEKYRVYLSGLWSVSGIENAMTGMPRMYGARFTYRFGD